MNRIMRNIQKITYPVTLKGKISGIITIVVIMMTILQIILTTSLNLRHSLNKAEDNFAINRKHIYESFIKKYEDITSQAIHWSQDRAQLLNLQNLFIDKNAHISRENLIRSSLKQLNSLIQQSDIDAAAVYINQDISHYISKSQNITARWNKEKHQMDQISLYSSALLNTKMPTPDYIQTTIREKSNMEVSTFFTNQHVHVRITIPIIRETMPGKNKEYFYYIPHPLTRTMKNTNKANCLQSLHLGTYMFFYHYNKEDLADFYHKNNIFLSFYSVDNKASLESKPFPYFDYTLKKSDGIHGSLLHINIKRRFTYHNEQFFQIISPFIVDDHILFYIGLSISLQKTYTEIRQYILIIILINILVLVLGVLSTHFLLSRFLTPVSQLTRAIQELSLGHFQIELPINSKDEIGYLSQSFLDMSQKLHISFQQIHEQKNKIENYNRHLEDMIKEKTKNLEKLNADLNLAYSKMKKEMQMASNIQMSLIPPELDSNEVIQTSIAYIPAEDVGGDFYDFFPWNNNKIGVVIADVSGHGIPASLIAAMVKITFKHNAQPERRAHEVIEQVNKDLTSVIGELIQYVTGFYCIIDKQNKILEYTSAGHIDVVLISEDKEIRLLKQNEMFLGIMEYTSCHSVQIPLKKGDRLILLTDGITEAFNPSHEMYGWTKLLDLLDKNRHLSQEDLKSLLLSEIFDYRDKVELDDDITFLDIMIK